jgi:hypothetical protein
MFPTIGLVNNCDIQSLATIGRWMTPLMQVTHSVIGIPRSMRDPVPTHYDACRDEKMGAASIYFVGMSVIVGLSAYAAYKDLSEGITHLRSGHIRAGRSALTQATIIAATGALFFIASKYTFY